MAQFARALRKRALTWYITFSKRQPRATKAEIKAQFLSFFKTPDAKHLAAKNLKTTSQKSGEIVRDYDKRWKYLLSQLDYVIYEKLLIQWFLAGLSPKVRRHISLETFKTYEDALTKALQVEMVEDIPTYPTDHRLEQQLESVQKSLKDLTLKNQEISCTKCLTNGHSKDNCRQDYSRQDVRFVQTKVFCDIFQEHEDHSMKDCPFNMKNGKASRCAICETKSHNTADC